MIDQAEAEQIAKKALEKRNAEDREFVIRKCVEKPFGWMFHYGLVSGEVLDGLNPVFIVERDGTLGHLAYKPPEWDYGIQVYEAEWNWRNKYKAALESAKQKAFDVAIHELEVCLAQLNANPLLNGPESPNLVVTLDCLNSLGDVQRQAKLLDASEANLLKAKRILDEWSPLKKVASLKERIPILESLELLRKDQRKRRERDLVHREMAIAYRMAHEYLKAQEIYEKQLQKRVDSYSPEHPAVAETLTDLASLKSEMGQFYEAQLLLEAAMKILEPLLQNHDALKKYATGDFEFPALLQSASETMICYADVVLMRQGKRDEATALRQRAKDLTETAGIKA